MKIIQTPIEGLFVLEPDVYKDKRGYFIESYNQRLFAELGLNVQFVQDNESCSTYGVIRGLHYQLEPYAQAKLVRVVKGKVYDVAVDIRPNSPTFGQWYGTELDEDSKRMMFIPRGFAHGFSVLSDVAIFSYKCDNFYYKPSERGILFRDKTLAIDWKIHLSEAVVSEKDLTLPEFQKAELF